MTVRFLDVGQGDAALVTTSDHHAILIDGGPPEGAHRVAEAVRGLAVDALVLSHAHADHLGDLPSLVRSLSLEQVFEPAFAPHVVTAYGRMLAELREAHVPVVAARRGDRFHIGGTVDVTVLAPREPLLVHTRSDLNANSVVVRVDHHAPAGDVRVLFEGDAEHPTEARLLEDATSLRADVLKVAHHGSKHATSERFLAAVAPRLAVISCGLDNDYGHPHAATLARLAAHGVAIARTDLEGDVTVTSDAGGLRWAVARDVSDAALRLPGRTPPGPAPPPEAP
jgi:competence protein ComEC